MIKQVIFKDYFVINGTSDRLWNEIELVEFLVKNQGRHIKLIVNPEAICLKSLGIYKLLDLFSFASVEIRTMNLFEEHDKYNINCDAFCPFLWEQPKIDTAWHTWNQKKVFFTFYGRPTANRLGLASYLFTHYRSQSHIHFSYNTDPDSLVLYEFDKLLNLRSESLSEAAEMLNHMPITVLPTTHYKRNEWYVFDDPLTAEYQNIFVDIVSETHLRGNTFFPTEKTTRPMWLKKPFITFASPNHLEYLRALGFKTFYEFWPEDYDSYQDRDRFLAILDVIDTLAKKSNNELVDMYQRMQPILDHNYNLLKTQSFEKHLLGRTCRINDDIPF